MRKVIELKGFMVGKHETTLFLVAEKIAGFQYDPGKAMTSVWTPGDEEPFRVPGDQTEAIRNFIEEG